MSEHANEGIDHARHIEAHHPGPKTYILIGLILFILTVIEVAVVYIEFLEPVLIPILMILMVVKFVLVIMYFMHLKFDNKLFSALFTAPLLIAVCITLALMALFGAFITVGSHFIHTGGH